MAAKIDRREFVKKTAYAAPVILTLTAMPSFAAAGSGKHKAGTIRENNTRGESATQSGVDRTNRESGESSQSRGRNRH